MKKKGYIVMSIVVVLLCVVLCRLWPRTVLPTKCSEVYRRYSEVEGIRASYLKDYRVNDTVTVGVTLLEAETDSGWVRLQEDFDLPVIPKELEELFCGDSNRVSVKCFPKKTPLYTEGDTLTDDWIAISRYKRTICHFVIVSKEQKRLIIQKNIDDNIENDSITYCNN